MPHLLAAGHYAAEEVTEPRRLSTGQPYKIPLLMAARDLVGGDDDTSVADKTTEVLTELSVDELRKEVAVVLPRLLKEHGDEVNRKREQTKKKLAALQSEKGEGKFANLPTAAYGNKEDFHKGLEVLGQPTASPEHAGGADNGVPEAQRFT